MGVVVGFHSRRRIAVHRDHDIIVWIDKDELAKDPGSHVRAAALKPPLVAVACIAFEGDVASAIQPSGTMDSPAAFTAPFFTKIPSRA